MSDAPPLDRLALAVLRRAAGDVDAVDRELRDVCAALRLNGLVGHRLGVTEAGRAVLERAGFGGGEADVDGD